MPWFQDNCFDDDPFDPLEVQRSRPVEDEEAKQWETVCQTSSPGPLILDDRASGDGTVVATLPDGRHLISLAQVGSPLDAMCAMEANTELICHARFWLLRLLRDREHARRREECLLRRIESLEARIRSRTGAMDEAELTRAGEMPFHPR
ncbi:MAG: hypothetical protein GXY83_14585 [Rhodopirellula sp.]|nr:hypothetical protein [Rhodopirellula sp.]